MPTLTLPQLVAGRDLAAAAVHGLGAVTDTEVVVDARPLVSGTASFAAQLVRGTLLEGRAAGLVVLGGPPEFVADVRAAAVELGVLDRMRFEAELAVPS